MTTGFIVTGTDTGIGKTVFCAALVSALSARYWKPIQAGTDATDIDIVANLADVPPSNLHPEAYRLKTPCSPHLAADIDNITIDPHALALPTPNTSNHQPLIIEGAGGLLVPLTHDMLQIEQFATWGLPVILCARTGLGTINHTLLSINAIRASNLTLHGVAFIGEPNAGTQETIARFGRVKILGCLPHVEPLNHQTLDTAFGAAFHVKDFA